MGILVVGSVALDTVESPFGKTEEALGGSATFFSTAASYFTDVSIVAVVGSDFPEEHLDFLRSKGIDDSGLAVADGQTFRWSGSYGFDLNERTTLETHLNVFESFDPQLPEHLASPEYLFLANIDPEIQLSVLEQAGSPKLVACDTMNFYITGKRGPLEELLRRVDVLIINDYECRELANESNLIRAAKIVHEMGPKTVIVKKGEHGALMLNEELFVAPAFPCEDVFDPTGAGDSFAGGFMGFLARSGDLSPEGMRKAVTYGTVLASFSVERFSVDGIANLAEADIRCRYNELKRLSAVSE